MKTLSFALSVVFAVALKAEVPVSVVSEAIWLNYNQIISVGVMKTHSVPNATIEVFRAEKSKKIFFWKNQNQFVIGRFQDSCRLDQLAS